MTKQDAGGSFNTKRSFFFFQYQRRPLLVFTQSVFNQDGLLRSTEHRRATIWQLQKLHLRLLNQGRLKSYRFGFSLSLWQTGAGSSGSSWIDAAAASRSRGAWASASRPASGEHHEDIFKDRAFSLHLAGERWMVKAAVTSHNEVIPEWKKEVLHSRLFFFFFFRPHENIPPSKNITSTSMSRNLAFHSALHLKNGCHILLWAISLTHTLVHTLHPVVVHNQTLPWFPGDTNPDRHLPNLNLAKKSFVTTSLC